MIQSDKPLFRELGALCTMEAKKLCAENTVPPWNIVKNVVQCVSGSAAYGHTVHYPQDWPQFPTAPKPLQEDKLEGLSAPIVGWLLPLLLTFQATSIVRTTLNRAQHRGRALEGSTAYSQSCIPSPEERALLLTNRLF